MAAQPLTFTLKLDFLLGYIPCHLPSPHPLEERTLRFPFYNFNSKPTECSCLSPRTTPQKAKFSHQDTAICHIAQTLQRTNILGDKGWTPARKSSLEHLSRWGIRLSEGPRAPEMPNGSYAGYAFVALEISTPAYYDTHAAMDTIRKFCAVMTSEYLIHTNASCGLSVGVSNGMHGFSFFQVKNLALFAWLYEPQLQSLIRTPRTRTSWASSMRDNANLQAAYQLSYDDQRIPTTVAILEILRVNNTAELMGLLGHKQPHIHGDINFVHFDAVGEEMKWNEAIEFRGQVATFHPDEVVNYVQVWVGVVGYIRHITSTNLYNLVQIGTSLERWEKLGDGLDGERELARGPILAEGMFTVINLLRYCNLHGSAGCYEERWNRHRQVEKRRSFSNRKRRRFTWDFEEVGEHSDRVGKFERSMKKLWTLSRQREELCNGNGWRHDEHWPAWPDHHQEFVKAVQTPPLGSPPKSHDEEQGVREDDSGSERWSSSEEEEGEPMGYYDAWDLTLDLPSRWKASHPRTSTP